MSRTEGPRGLSEDARFELAMAAAGRARKNRPTALLVAAGAALVLSGVTAVWGFSARRTAMAAVAREQQEAVDVERLAQEWTRLDDAERSGQQGNIGKPLPDLLTRMEALAHRAGLKETPKPPRPVQTNRSGVTITEYIYTEVRDPELSALMQWMWLAQSEVPGLEVYGVTLTPEANNWNLSVTFRRWERAGS